ncbi:MAG: YgeY family selenium metabolism-linked hydrolase, partial [Endomicrobiia bacterium]|nr:YgeY family selenium metabolism-linked hydrolase [Endomicrobiia bacterium]
MNRREKQCIAFLKRLVSTKSYSGQETAVSKIIAAEMRHLGYDEVRADSFHNVVGIIGDGSGVRILFDAHTDTVGIADPKNWKTAPFKAVIKSGRLYGRGAADDKGSVAAMVYAGAALKKSARADGFTLMVSASALEETGGTEWLDFITKKLKFRPDFAVIGEPSDLKVIRGHKGRAEFKIAAVGKSAHASIPEKGVNAVHKAAALVGKIAALNKKYKAAELGRPVISVTLIETQNASINTIPERCVFYIDRRTVETETRRRVENEIRKACGRDGKIEYVKYYSPWVIGANHPLIKASAKAFRNAYGNAPKIVTWPFCTNGSHTMGDRGIPSVGFGPGKEEHAHIANESIALADVVR